MSDQSINNNNYTRRFGGIARLYGDVGLNQLKKSHVCVIGIGGVGSWVAESLARSAVGTITLIDMDIVNESNVNRQLVASTETLGRDKVQVMSDRIKSINPDCEVCVIDDFLSTDNLSDLISDRYSYVIDCIDDFRTKAALIAFCKQQKIKLLTVGAAGGQTDPSKVRQCDLSRTKHDALFAKTKKLLRQDFGFARNPKRSFGVACVYSDEQAIYPDGQGGLSPQKPVEHLNDETASTALSCSGGVGSVTHVTATFAFFATAHVLRELAAC